MFQALLVLFCILSASKGALTNTTTTNTTTTTTTTTTCPATAANPWVPFGDNLYYFSTDLKTHADAGKPYAQSRDLLFVALLCLHALLCMALHVIMA
jgi:hypothetical protein